MSPNDRDELQVNSPSKTVLQAIYHHVTGKTENLSRNLDGNVVIESDDIDRLFEMLMDQVSIHECVFEPTTTIVVKQARSRSNTYSSWERFKALRVNDHEITSDISMKIEFVIRLPGTATPQRCIVNVTLDSSLPIFHESQEGFDEFFPLPFMVLSKQEWRTVIVSIDFVDFLIAKSFLSVVEEWFGTTKKTPHSRLNESLYKAMPIINTLIDQLGLIGMAIYLAGYVWFTGKSFGSLSQLTLAIAVALFILSAFRMFQATIRKIIWKRTMANITPSVVLITQGDRNAYEKLRARRNKPRNTLITLVATTIGAVAVNIVSSFLYAYFVIN